MWGSDDDEVNPKDESWSAWWVDAPPTTLINKSEVFQSIFKTQFYLLIVRCNILFPASLLPDNRPNHTYEWDIRVGYTRCLVGLLLPCQISQYEYSNICFPFTPTYLLVNANPARFRWRYSLDKKIDLIYCSLLLYVLSLFGQIWRLPWSQYYLLHGLITYANLIQIYNSFSHVYIYFI